MSFLSAWVQIYTEHLRLKFHQHCTWAITITTPPCFALCK